MKTGAVLGVRQGGTVEVPNPIAKDDIVVVKIHSAPMCTEFHAFKDGAVGNSFGHEAAGEVVFVDKANNLKVGDRVIVQPQSPCGKCFLCKQGDFIHCINNRNYFEITGSTTGSGTMAQYCLKAEDYLTVIPNDMSYDNASMGCCALGPSFTALELMSAGPFDTVLISGLGPVGLGAIINARFKGVRNIIGVDSHPYRAELAKKLGANIVIDPTQEDALQQIMEYTKGKGVDKSVETSGRAESKKLLLDVLRAKGQSALIGWGGTLDVNTIISKGLIIHGVWHYNLINANKIIEVINSSKELLDILITHKFPLSKIQDAWEIQCSGNCGKVLLHPWEE